jgi:hypothetical protein
LKEEHRTYTYAWTGPDEFTASTEDITVLAAGDYTVTVTDANGCEATATYTIVQETSTLTLVRNSSPPPSALQKSEPST